MSDRVLAIIALICAGSAWGRMSALCQKRTRAAAIVTAVIAGKSRIFASSFHFTAAASWLCAERFEFVIRGDQLKGIFRTALLSYPEQASSLVFAALLQRQFTAEEIGLANLGLLLGSIAVRSCGKHSLWCHLAKVEADDRRRPLCHVDMDC